MCQHYYEIYVLVIHYFFASKSNLSCHEGVHKRKDVWRKRDYADFAVVREMRATRR